MKNLIKGLLACAFIFGASGCGFSPKGTKVMCAPHSQKECKDKDEKGESGGSSVKAENKCW